MSRLLSLVAALLLAAPAAAEDGGFPQIVGTWAGTYLVGFAESNPLRAEKGLMKTEMELEITKLDGNLITGVNRWREIGATDWIEEDVIGTFRLDEPTEFVLAETGSPTDSISIGTFSGVYLAEGALLVTYVGPLNGVAFAAQLVKKPDAPSGDGK